MIGIELSCRAFLDHPKKVYSYRVSPRSHISIHDPPVLIRSDILSFLIQERQRMISRCGGQVTDDSCRLNNGVFTESQDECNGACREPEAVHTIKCCFRRVMDTSAVIQTQAKAVGTPELTLRIMRGFDTGTDTDTDTVTDAGNLSPTVYYLYSIVSGIKPF